MTKEEATIEAEKINKMTGTKASVVRILNAIVDPIVEGDNGWDVEVTVTDFEWHPAS
jgi:hypothetical protein